ncbi:flagellar assembly protein FliW [Paenarthrobacter sp. Z7-10]|uniref:flagellar assembly protein FliW n=1 Tax=Paenarthrobacter sp. Z7-10 TaxID=2787635 RepID=UPI0022A953BB|nr:flagellar assembly protein FliW [Paenarthrobacter sp. Z7-10]MCZ2403332.1 flagellar assembly protein FliW [Paenarthrobacter sp. Z7-10]
MSVLTFLAPPPGLAPLVDFDLKPVSGAAGLYTLQSVANAEKRMFVLDASVYLPEYSPILSDAQCASLTLGSPEDAQVLVVANPGTGSTTLNLLAPIVVNRTTDICSQLILEGQGWPLRAVLG